MNVSMAVVATMTRGMVTTGDVSELWPAGVEDILYKEKVKNLLWHLYVPGSIWIANPDESAFESCRKPPESERGK
jgi:hypothetical protein